MPAFDAKTRAELANDPNAIAGGQWLTIMASHLAISARLAARGDAQQKEGLARAVEILHKACEEVAAATQIDSPDLTPEPVTSTAGPSSFDVPGSPKRQRTLAEIAQENLDALRSHTEPFRQHVREAFPGLRPEASVKPGESFGLIVERALNQGSAVLLRGESAHGPELGDGEAVLLATTPAGVLGAMADGELYEFDYQSHRDPGPEAAGIRANDWIVTAHRLGRDPARAVEYATLVAVAEEKLAGLLRRTQQAAERRASRRPTS